MMEVHAPSVRIEGAVKLAGSMQSFGFFGEGCLLCLLVPPSMESHYRDNLRRYGSSVRIATEDPWDHPAAPMFRLRQELHRKTATGLPWMVFDDDDEFREGSLVYYQQVIDFISYYPPVPGKKGWFVGTAGHFGSISQEDRFHYSPPNALMPKGHGLVFPGNFRISEIRHPALGGLYGGLEEALCCALAIEDGFVPVKRFRSPNKIKFRTAAQREDSAIHDYEIWRFKGMKAIREICGDPSWEYPRDMTHKGPGVRKSPKAYSKMVANCAKRHPIGGKLK